MIEWSVSSFSWNNFDIESFRNWHRVTCCLARLFVKPLRHATEKENVVTVHKFNLPHGVKSSDESESFKLAVGTLPVQMQ